MISGHYSGWNFGLQYGFGAMLIALFVIAAMYWGLIFSIAEMSPALPHTGAAYSFARSALGPWGGMITGLAESIEYILTPAVIVFFIGSYMTAIFETPAAAQPLWWAAAYAVFLLLNLRGVELSFKVSVLVTPCRARALLGERASAFRPRPLGAQHRRGAGRQGGGIARRQRPMAAVRYRWSIRRTAVRRVALPRHRATPAAARGVLRPEDGHAEGSGLRHDDADDLGLLDHLPEFRRRFRIPTRCTGRIRCRAHEPLLDGFRVIYGTATAKVLAFLAVIGLIASFHTIIYAYGRQIYSLSRAGYYMPFMS